uniref:Uncharacterized protein n=1 Tax=Oryza punctata TaxID=4537 RepID=A0A0E0JW68_ORYPU
MDRGRKQGRMKKEAISIVWQQQSFLQEGGAKEGKGAKRTPNIILAKESKRLASHNKKDIQTEAHVPALLPPTAAAPALARCHRVWKTELIVLYPSTWWSAHHGGVDVFQTTNEGRLQRQWG